jgi:hypothetical protein
MEETTLNLIVQQARALGCERLIGVYRPTAKNAMVRDHYPRLGFAPIGDGIADYVLALDGWTALPTTIVSEAAPPMSLSTEARTMPLSQRTP